MGERNDMNANPNMIAKVINMKAVAVFKKI
jgi:hypothetical protein